MLKECVFFWGKKLQNNLPPPLCSLPKSTKHFLRVQKKGDFPITQKFSHFPTTELFVRKNTHLATGHFCPPHRGKKKNNFLESEIFRLVVSTHLKNLSQIGNLPQVGVKIKNIWNHHLVFLKVESTMERANQWLRSPSKEPHFWGGLSHDRSSHGFSEAANDPRSALIFSC